MELTAGPAASTLANAMESKTAEASDPASWVDRYGDELFRYALFRVRNAEGAEEIVQETFLAALKGRDSFSGRSTEKTWLFGILKHKIIDAFRRSGRERPASTLEAEEEDDATPIWDQAGHFKKDLDGFGAEPGALVERKEFRAVLMRCVENLPPRLSRVFLLREIEDMDREEICNLMNITATNLGVMLHRSRARIRQCLETHWFAGDPEAAP